MDEFGSKERFPDLRQEKFTRLEIIIHIKSNNIFLINQIRTV